MIYVFLYKIICLVTGIIIIFLGYKLFLKGIFNESGELEGNWKDLKLVVKKAAPGTYFVLFGSLIIAMTVFKGFENEELTGNSYPKTHLNIKPKDSTSLSKDSIIIK